MKAILRYYLLFILALILLPVGAIFASDISNTKWLAIVTVTNNSTTTANVATVFSLNVTSMVNQGFCNDNLTDIAMVNLIEDPFMPGYNGNPWCLFIPSIGTGQNANYDIYTKDAVSTSTVYFPGDGGMTVSDNASLEWGSSGNFTITCMFNPASTEDILLKTNALKISGDGAGNAVAYAYNGTTTAATFRPNAAGDLTELTPSAGANYACSGDNNDATSVYQATSSYKSDLYNIPNHTAETGLIYNVTAYFRIKTAGGGDTAKAKPYFKINGTSYAGTEQSNATTSYVTKSQTYTTSPDTSLAWTWSEIDSLQYGVQVKSTLGAVNNSCADVWLIVTYGIPSATITKVVTAVEHTFKLSLSGGLLSFQVDSGTANTTSMSGNITNNNSPWVIGDDNITPYIVSANMGVGASLVSAWAWEYGATFQDSIGSNDATPVFRTTSSDADVSANVSSFQPMSQAEAIVSSTSANLTVLNDPTAPSQLYTEGTFTYIPGGVVFNELLDVSGTPRALWWYPFLFLGLALVGMMLYGATTVTVSMSSNAAAHMGSLLLQSIVCELGFVVLAVMGAIPLFPALIFPIGAIAVIMSTKHYGYG